MVDPVGGVPDGKTRNGTAAGLHTAATTAAVVGIRGCLAVFLALFVAVLAVPWVASGLFFYNAVQASLAAQRYQQAPPCVAVGSTAHCSSLVHGTIVGVDTHTSRRSLTTIFSIQLPAGVQSGRMTTFLSGPPSWLQTGQAVDVQLYEGKITKLGYDGVQADTDDNPVVHQHDLLISGSICLAFGLIFEGSIFIGMRRRTKGPGPPAS
jgi:hypothetical protein